ncbi:ecdysteroid-regulated 16 kDa protein-like [Ischnura elegans]|uniref:ecdysteroid-regulated 16 kDa protein-like n=1 Tax=Ischnura elegans TaxID=197161 RepID=UPI001ED86685|nr:ecdysteroid-regulated 16 kDa protein-like [Ischnura elegans]
MDEVRMLGKLWCILSFAIILSSAGNFYDCGSKVGNYSSVTITNCGTAPICILKRNSNVTIQFDFTPFENTNTVSAVVHGIKMGIPVPFHFPDEAACNRTLKCPLFKGKTYSYQATFPIKKKYPAIRLDVKWELKNDDQRDIACILIPAKIM